jgi:hypothetical protein
MHAHPTLDRLTITEEPGLIIKRTPDRRLNLAVHTHVVPPIVQTEMIFGIGL